MVREKVKVGNRPKSWVKSLRTTVGRRGWGRRHENGAFDTEIFRRSGAALSVRSENGEKMENAKTTIVTVTTVTVTVTTVTVTVTVTTTTTSTTPLIAIFMIID